jgi:hypothetical protein
MAANLRMPYPAPAANPSGGPAALAAARVGRAATLLGAFGLGCLWSLAWWAPGA